MPYRGRTALRLRDQFAGYCKVLLAELREGFINLLFRYSIFDVGGDSGNFDASSSERLSVTHTAAMLGNLATVLIRP